MNRNLLISAALTAAILAFSPWASFPRVPTSLGLDVGANVSQGSQYLQLDESAAERLVALIHEAFPSTRAT